MLDYWLLGGETKKMMRDQTATQWLIYAITVLLGIIVAIAIYKLFPDLLKAGEIPLVA